jgi:hypothetical protein
MDEFHIIQTKKVQNGSFDNQQPHTYCELNLSNF